MYIPSTQLVAAAAATATDPIQQIFGTPTTAFEFDTSSLSGLTAIGTPDAEDANTTVPSAYYVKRTSTATNLNGRYLAAPAAPWTVITLALGDNVRANFHKALLWYAADSGGSPGAIDLLPISSAVRKPEPARWTNPTTFSALITMSTGVALTAIAAPYYLAMRVNSSSSVDFLLSYDGRVWTPLVVARNPAITIAFVGIGVTCENADSLPAAVAFDFLRIWNSALTMPGA